MTSPAEHPSPPSAEEAARLPQEAFMDPDWGAFVWTAVTTGARGGELCALGRADVEADEPGSGHGDDDLAARVSVLHVAQAGSGVGQGVGPVEDGRELSGFDEVGDGEQVFPLPLVRQRSESLPDQNVDGDHQEDSPDRAEQAPVG